MKKCSCCREEKPPEQFARSISKKDGIQSFCKDCGTRKAKAWYKKNKDRPEVQDRIKWLYSRRKAIFRAVVDDLKASYGCCCCGEQEAVCLDFHHPGKKDKNVSYWVVTNSVIKLWEELNRCVVICANCHRRHHAGRIQVTNQPIQIDFESLLQQIRQRDDATQRKRTRVVGLAESKAKPKREKLPYRPRMYARKVDRPSCELMHGLLWSKPIKAIAKDYGISESAVHKWVRIYGLKKPGRGYWQKRQAEEVARSKLS